MSDIQSIQGADLSLAFETVSQLRPHLTLERFIDQVNEQTDKGYRLVGIKKDGFYRAVAGYRFSQALAWGKFLYCDDLVVHQDYRRHGYGHKLMEFLYSEALTHKCDTFHLDSGVQRHEAHRLYLKEGMDISSHHFQRACHLK